MPLCVPGQPNHCMHTVFVGRSRRSVALATDASSPPPDSKGKKSKGQNPFVHLSVAVVLPLAHSDLTQFGSLSCRSSSPPPRIPPSLPPPFPRFSSHTSTSEVFPLDFVFSHLSSNTTFSTLIPCPPSAATVACPLELHLRPVITMSMLTSFRYPFAIAGEGSLKMKKRACVPRFSPS
jgi:hypothetical protein